MRIYCKLLALAILGLLAGGCDPQPPAESRQPDKSFTLRTGIQAGKMVFIGTGGEINGLINPDLVVEAGDLIRITVINGDGIPHDFAIPELGVQTPMLAGEDASTEVVFEVQRDLTYSYFCTLAGHRQAGMEGSLVVEAAEHAASSPFGGVSIRYAPLQGSALLTTGLPG